MISQEHQDNEPNASISHVKFKFKFHHILPVTPPFCRDSKKEKSAMQEVLMNSRCVFSTYLSA
jgi:hypothetical protein